MVFVSTRLALVIIDPLATLLPLMTCMVTHLAGVRINREKLPILLLVVS